MSERSGVREAPSKAEAERMLRQRGLTEIVGTGDWKEPRFPVKSLDDAELAYEIETAAEGPWREACVAEERERAHS